MQRIPPTSTMQVRANEPPYERNGSGSPVTGMSPIVIAMFTIMWNRNMVQAPMVMSVMKGSANNLHVELARHRNNV